MYVRGNAIIPVKLVPRMPEGSSGEVTGLLQDWSRGNDRAPDGGIVELRFFGGLSNEESSQILGISPATVQRKWNGAKAWLYHELSRREAR